MASHPITIGFAAWSRHKDEHGQSSGTAQASTSASPPGKGFMSNATFKASSDTRDCERDSEVTREYYEALERFLEAKRIVLAAGLPQQLAASGFWGASDEDIAIAQRATTDGAENALVIVTPDEARQRLAQARAALVASIPDHKTVTNENSSRLLASAFQRPVVVCRPSTTTTTTTVQREFV
jgi:hypothetical protein